LLASSNNAECAFVKLTNDGSAIPKGVEVTHPAGEKVIELSRMQNEVCGDGAKSVIVLGA
jgi:chaperonin GroEL (HSP60 family)